MPLAPLTAQWLIPEWPVPPHVRALSTFRLGGASRHPYSSLNLGDHVGDGRIAVDRNRRTLREAAGLPVEPSWLVQLHGSTVVDLDTPHAQRSGDAAVSRQTGTLCAILSADCLPVLFTTDAGDRVGAAHAGWRGLAGGVLEATVKALEVPPKGLLAWLGPAIGARHFEVGGEVRDEFLRGDAWCAAAFVANDRGRFMADLYALARRRLARLGVERVYGGDHCTYSQSDKYFSHRRDGRTGRQATIIWLEQPAQR